MNNRTLKVRKGHWDYIPKRAPSSGNRVAPFILLKGLCLEHAGFTIYTPYQSQLRTDGCRLFEIVAAEAERRASESFGAFQPNAAITRRPHALHCYTKFR
ncbi:MAG: hypothetical protein RH947_00975 [Alcanivorax sp.]